MPLIQPAKEGGELLLFDAGRHDPAPINHYTASWRKGSNLTPVAKTVRKDGQAYIEIAYKGDTGMACSTTFFEKARGNPTQASSTAGSNSSSTATATTIPTSPSACRSQTTRN